MSNGRHEPSRSGLVPTKRHRWVPTWTSLGRPEHRWVPTGTSLGADQGAEQGHRLGSGDIVWVPTGDIGNETDRGHGLHILRLGWEVA